MPVNAKPFNIADKLIKRVFYGKPNVFSSVDLNQLIDLNMDAIHRMSDRLGGVSEGLVFSTSDLAHTCNIGTPEYELVYDLQMTASNVRVYHKNCRFTVPTFSFAATLSTSVLTTLSIYLIADRETVDFATDPTIGGVDGGGLPAPIASSDAVRYHSERVALGQNDTLPSLTGTEEIICKIASVVYHLKEWNVGSSTIDIYEPMLVLDTPLLSDLMADFITTPTATVNKPDGLFGFISRLNTRIRQIDFKLGKISIINGQELDVLVQNSLGFFVNTPLANVAVLADALVGSWIEVGGGGGAPAFGSNWTYDSTYKVYFRKNGHNDLILDGVLKVSGGSPAATLWTIPATHRPNRNVIVPVSYYDSSVGGNYVSVGLLITASTGAVTLAGTGSITPDTGDLVFLSGVRVPMN